MNVAGSSAANPIVVDDSDDSDNGSTPNQQYGTLLAEPIVISDSENEDWPQLLKHWAKNKTPRRTKPPDKIQFISLDFGKCTCSRSCSTSDCLNAKSAK
jgi:hypothetical protein